MAIIDDVDGPCEAAEALLRSGGFEAASVSSDEQFPASPGARKARCLILDVRLSGIGGAELQRHPARIVDIPFVFTTAPGDGAGRLPPPSP